MSYSKIKDLRFLGLPPKDLFFTLLIMSFFISFYFIFKAGFILKPEPVTDVVKYVILGLQIALLSALTLACFYAYQLTKNTSFYYFAFCWAAHAIYKIFTIIPPTEDPQDPQILLIGIIALVADLPLFLSSFSHKQRELWLPIFPILVFLVTVCIHIDVFTISSPLTKKELVYFIGPLQSIIILIWLFYSTIIKNIFDVSRNLSIWLAITVIALAVSQTPFIYYESYCPFYYPDNPAICKPDNMTETFLRLFSLGIFSSFLAIVFFIVKDKLSGIRNELQAKGEFEELGYLTASIEHELRTPLAVFDNEIHLLKRKYQSDEGLVKKLDLLETYRLRILAAADIINTLRSSRDDIINELRPINLKKIINMSIEDVKKEFGQKLVGIYFQINEKTQGLEVEVAAPLMEQAIVNILKNAIESILSNYKRGEIKIDIYLEDKETVTMSFWDNGVGFILEDIEKISKPDYTTKEKAQGKPNRGLGLFVCNKIINLHGGKLHFTNNSDNGAIVLITLPRFISRKNKRHQNDKPV